MPWRALAPGSWESSWTYCKIFCLNNSFLTFSQVISPVNCTLNWQISFLHISPFGSFCLCLYFPLTDESPNMPVIFYFTLVSTGNCSSCGLSLTFLSSDAAIGICLYFQLVTVLSCCVYVFRFFIAEKKEKYSRYLSVACTIFVPLSLLLLQLYEWNKG